MIKERELQDFHLLAKFNLKKWSQTIKMVSLYPQSEEKRNILMIE